MAPEKNYPAKLFVPAILALLVLLAGCAQKQPAENELVVYTYDSMVSEYGLGPKIVPKFEEQCDCNVIMVAKGDAGQVLTALELEKNNPRADVVIGIDNSLSSKAISKGLLEKFTPKNINLVPESLRFDSEGFLTPYDYGFIAFVYDSEKVDVPLEGFNDILSPKLKGKIAIQNPRTSSPGLALLLWTVAVYGDPGYKEFWKEFRPNVLTVTQGWDESAGLFRAGEVPIYLSYATSPPYYAEFEGIGHFLAAGFREGHYIQIEGMGVVKGAKHRKLAEQFIEFSLDEKFQEEVPFTQFMFPVNEGVELPEAFRKYALRPETQLELDPALVQEKEEEWVSEWEKIMSSG